MRAATPDASGQRLLVLAPRGRDAGVIGEVLGRERLDCVVVPDVGALLAGIDAGAGAAIVAEEALDEGGLGVLAFGARRKVK